MEILLASRESFMRVSYEATPHASYHSIKGREEDEVHKSKLLRIERIPEPTTWLILPCLTAKVR